MFLSNGCNEDDENESLTVEEGCDAPRCYVSSTRQIYISGEEIQTTWEYKTVNGEKLLDKNISDNYIKEFLYNSSNFCTGYREYKGIPNKLSAEQKYTYNSNGKLESITQIYYDNNQQSNDEYVRVFEYDGQDRLKTMKYYEGEVYIGEHIVQEYNSAGQPTIIYFQDTDGNTLPPYISEYADCSLIKNKKYVSKNLIQVIGDITSIFVDCESGCPVKRVNYSNDTNNNIDEYINEYNEDGLIESRSYNRSDDVDLSYVIYYQYNCD
ncbi:hypothetical protein [Bernardetia sp. MNP-M8]|uniref:hypothetical protein n=1 Tax=Bernardetia sp. MNP-M8 TaxID=3127470 RepID=UPI0030D2E708